MNSPRAAYSSDQPRDEHGKWTTGGGSSPLEWHPENNPRLTGPRDPHFVKAMRFVGEAHADLLVHTPAIHFVPSTGAKSKHGQFSTKTREINVWQETEGSGRYVQTLVHELTHAKQHAEGRAYSEWEAGLAGKEARRRFRGWASRKDPRFASISFPLAPSHGARLLMLARMRAAYSPEQPREEPRVAASKHPILALADRFAPKLSVLVRYAFAVGRKRLPDTDAAIEATASVLKKMLPKMLGEIAEAGAAVELKVAEELRTARTTKIDKKTQAARAWATDHAAELIKGLSKTTRERVKAVIAEFVDRPSKMAPALRQALGDADRAEMIARTESMRAAHKGQQLLWQEAQSDGLLGEKARRVWIVTEDEAACPICLDLDGKTAALDDAYDGGSEYFDGPPAHPSCRCTEGIA